ncbi:DUF11 domain-containing protein [Candidatus Gottesmanbacteria bacterium]|nr:DUF11 domain-containing protein [Candidatus Gottesmanbacteria bacterium]
MRYTKSILKNIVITSGLFLGSLLFASNVIADSGCTPIYGGGVTCPKRGEMIVDKQIKYSRVEKGGNVESWVDNITEFDVRKFKPEEEIEFRIFVRNTGGAMIDEITVTDIWPEFVTFISGPGEYTKDQGVNGAVKFKINNLADGESREYHFTGRVYKAENIPNPIRCDLVNRVQISASGDRFNEDIAKFCIQRGDKVITGKKVIPPVKEIPSTGPQEVVLSFAALSSVLGAGVVLRKKAEKLIK